MKTCPELLVLTLSLFLIQCRCYGVPTDKRVTPTVTAVTAPVVHGEGPHWDDESGALFFVDISSRLVNRYDPKTGKVTHIEFADTDANGGGVSLVVPVANTHAKRLLASDGHKLVVFSWNYENTTIHSTKSNGAFEIAVVEKEQSKRGNRWNDGKADAKGRLWGGTMGPEPIVGQVTPNQGNLFLVEADNGFHPVIEVPRVSISNGLAWNKDNSLFYYIDTATRQIDVFDFDLKVGTIAYRRKVFNFAENNISGSPDGMTIDNNENLWIACFGGSQVINVNPKTGKLIQKVEIPATRVTSVMFDGPKGNILYVTTSSLGLTDDEVKEKPLSGAVFAVTGLGVSALEPANNFIVPLEKLQ